MSAWQERLRRDREEIEQEVARHARPTAPKTYRKHYFDGLTKGLTGGEVFALNSANKAKTFADSLRRAVRRNGLDFIVSQTAKKVNVRPRTHADGQT